MPNIIQLETNRLPEISECGYCGTARGILVSMEMDSHYITRGWVIACTECACTSDAHRCLPTTVDQWNAMQVRREKLMIQAQAGQEAH